MFPFHAVCAVWYKANSLTHSLRHIYARVTSDSCQFYVYGQMQRWKYLEVKYIFLFCRCPVLLPPDPCTEYYWGYFVRHFVKNFMDIWGINFFFSMMLSLHPLPCRLSMPVYNPQGMERLAGSPSYSLTSMVYELRHEKM